MMKIAVLTATRAEYGLLTNVIDKLNSSPDFDLRVVVTGMHLSEDYGLTYREIEDNGIQIDAKIDILSEEDGAVGISKTIASAISKFADYFDKRRPDALLVLGDRYETLAVCIAAMNEQIPIIHIHGGETTQGAIDEAIRHSITKMSYLHFATTQEYRDRIIQLGENPERVFWVGAPGVENVMSVEIPEKAVLEEYIKFDLSDKYMVATYHPVTLERDSIEYQILEFTKALSSRPDYRYLITKANADAGGRLINEMLEEFSKDNENVVLVDSLGMKRYLCALKNCAMVIGNSSSGIIEAPSFGIPTVNIGDRQLGRARASSVIDCGITEDEILKAIEKAEEPAFVGACHACRNPYEKENVADNIVNIIKEQMLEKDINLKKKFYDIRRD